MKLIFLDIDGVLNTLGNHTQRSCKIDTDKLRLVCGLSKRCRAEIVISSYWRLSAMNDIKKLFSSEGIEILGATTALSGNKRQKEILDFMDKIEDHIEGYVILDDNRYYRKDAKQHLVLTSSSKGLTEEHIKRAETILCRLK